jgi:hypothetical protein
MDIRECALLRATSNELGYSDGKGNNATWGAFLWACDCAQGNDERVVEVREAGVITLGSWISE